MGGYTQWPLMGELYRDFRGVQPPGIGVYCECDQHDFVHGDAEFSLQFTAAGLLQLWNATLGRIVHMQGQVHRRESSTGAHAAFFWHNCNDIVITLLQGSA